MAGRGFDRDQALGRTADIFRAQGYDGGSLAAITAATGLGKGSLYNAFPDGKAEMAGLCLDAVDRRFAGTILAPLKARGAAIDAVSAMFAALADYHDEGRRACLYAVFSHDSARKLFAARIGDHYRNWRRTLAGCLQAGGLRDLHAERLAAETLETLIGAMVLARAENDPSLYRDAALRLVTRLSALLKARG